jgi:hypothetical protein
MLFDTNIGTFPRQDEIFVTNTVTSLQDNINNNTGSDECSHST